jgi:hypothetical protein
MSDPYISERERERVASKRDGLQNKQTLEMVELERLNAPLPGWQQALVNGFAIVGVIAVIAVILSVLGVF